MPSVALLYVEGHALGRAPGVSLVLEKYILGPCGVAQSSPVTACRAKLAANRTRFVDPPSTWTTGKTRTIAVIPESHRINEITRRALLGPLWRVLALHRNTECPNIHHVGEARARRPSSTRVRP